MFFDFDASLLAEAESTSRVNAKMVVEAPIEEDSSASTTAPPCLPVAPTTRTFRLEAIGDDPRPRWSNELWEGSVCSDSHGVHDSLYQNKRTCKGSAQCRLIGFCVHRRRSNR